mgnify:CR=1 FL=1
MADRTGWFTRPQLADMLAVSESTPGPIGVNMATYVGFVTCGIPGAIISTLGLVTPSVIVILIIAAFLKPSATTAMWRRRFTVCARRPRLWWRRRACRWWPSPC